MFLALTITPGVGAEALRAGMRCKAEKETHVGYARRRRRGSPRQPRYASAQSGAGQYPEDNADSKQGQQSPHH